MTILGIDPGIATLGYGVIEADKGKFLPVDYGVVTTPKGVALPRRLEMLEEGVVALFDRFSPDEVAVECDQRNHGRRSERRGVAHRPQTRGRQRVRVHAQSDKDGTYGIRRRGQETNAAYGAGSSPTQGFATTRRRRGRSCRRAVSRAHGQNERAVQDKVTVTADFPRIPGGRAARKRADIAA